MGERKRLLIDRVTNLIDALSSDPNRQSHKILEAVAEKTDKKGAKSEERAQNLLQRIGIIDKLEKSTPEEDKKYKYDFMVYFREDINIKPIPIEVKTSKEMANDIKSIARRKGRRIIVLAAGEAYTDHSIIQSFWDQLKFFNTQS